MRDIKIARLPGAEHLLHTYNSQRHAITQRHWEQHTIVRSGHLLNRFTSSLSQPVSRDSTRTRGVEWEACAEYVCSCGALLQPRCDCMCSGKKRLARTHTPSEPQPAGAPQLEETYRRQASLGTYKSLIGQVVSAQSVQSIIGSSRGLPT